MHKIIEETMNEIQEIVIDKLKKLEKEPNNKETVLAKITLCNLYLNFNKEDKKEEGVEEEKCQQ